mgnify:CR=1 FL=1
MPETKEIKKTARKKPVKKRSKHDQLVKNFLSDKATAKSLFLEYLPPEIVNLIDLNTLKICKDTFIDKKLANYLSDILYQVNLRPEVIDHPGLFIYLLIDHKSEEEWFISFQFLKYKVRAWELYLKQNKGAKYLPVIIPMVIYHGPQEWRVDTRFISLFKAPEYLKEYIPDFEYKLFSFSPGSDVEIKGEVLLRILLTTLKYISTPELSDKLRKEIFPLFNEIKDKTKVIEYLESLLRYLTESARNLPVRELHKSVSQFFEKGGDLMATIAEKWKEEGKEEGIEKVVKNSLEAGLPIKTIKKITGLPLKEINRLKEKMVHV